MRRHCDRQLPPVMRAVKFPCREWLPLWGQLAQHHAGPHLLLSQHHSKAAPLSLSTISPMGKWVIWSPSCHLTSPENWPDVARMLWDPASWFLLGDNSSNVEDTECRLTLARAKKKSVCWPRGYQFITNNAQIQKMWENYQEAVPWIVGLVAGEVLRLHCDHCSLTL